MICPMVMIIVIWKNVLQTRLYYECLLNEMLQDFESDPMTNPGVWFILIWGVGAFCMLFFMNSTLPTTQLVFSMLAYFAPIATFLIFLFKNWSIENFLIPVPSYCSTDPEHAGKILHHASRCLIPEKSMQVAFHNTSERLGKEKASTKNSEAFFAVLKEEAVKELEAVGQDEPELSGMECITSPLGLVERPPYRTRFTKVSKPEVLTTGYFLSHGYWIYNLLFSTHLVDARSATFRSWARAFLGFVFLSALIFIWLMARTTATYLVFEHLMSSSSVWAQTLCFKGEHVLTPEIH